MSEPLTLLAITEKQRDFLSSALHNSERKYILLEQVLATVSTKLASADQRISELEAALSRIEEAKAAGKPPEHLRRIGEAGPNLLVPLSEDDDAAA